jgi:hypothetical protein
MMRELQNKDVGKSASSSSRRPFTVELKRVGPQWSNIGLALCPDDSPNYLTIDDVVSPSLISQWNDEQGCGRPKVKPGDMIAAVNRKAATSDTMLLLIKMTGKGEDLVFTIDPGAEAFDARPSTGPASVPEPANVDGKRQMAKRDAYPELKPHFATLGISPTSSDEAIRRYYKRLARIWHPDKNPDILEKATERFQAINTAYEAIKLKRKL